VDLGGGVRETGKAQLPDLPAVAHDEGRAPEHGSQRTVDASRIASRFTGDHLPVSCCFLRFEIAPL
jgi:hypothetical protein